MLRYSGYPTMLLKNFIGRCFGKYFYWLLPNHNEIRFYLIYSCLWLNAYKSFYIPGNYFLVFCIWHKSWALLWIWQSRGELYELLHNFDDFIPECHEAHPHKKSKPLESFADYNSAHLKFQWECYFLLALGWQVTCMNNYDDFMQLNI